MAFDWLYGRPEDRSYVLDLDTVRELASRVRTRVPGMTVDWNVQPSGSGVLRSVPDYLLGTISAADRSRLALCGRLPNQSETYTGVRGVDMNFVKGTQPGCFVQANDSAIAAHLIAELRKILVDSGRPRFRIIVPRTPLVLLPSLLLLASWIWLQATSRLPIAGYVFGWLIVAIVVGVTGYFVRVELMRASMNPRQYRWPGHRIQNETRAETYARRADTHKNLKVALITAPISLIVGVGGTLLTLALRSKL